MLPWSYDTMGIRMKCIKIWMQKKSVQKSVHSRSNHFRTPLVVGERADHFNKGHRKSIFLDRYSYIFQLSVFVIPGEKGTPDVSLPRGRNLTKKLWGSLLLITVILNDAVWCQTFLFKLLVHYFLNREAIPGPLFLYFRLFYVQLTENKCTIDIAHVWVQTWVLWCLRQPLC